MWKWLKDALFGKSQEIEITRNFEAEQPRGYGHVENYSTAANPPLPAPPVAAEREEREAVDTYNHIPASDEAREMIQRLNALAPILTNSDPNTQRGNYNDYIMNGDPANLPKPPVTQERPKQRTEPAASDLFKKLRQKMHDKNVRSHEAATKVFKEFSEENNCDKFKLKLNAAGRPDLEEEDGRFWLSYEKGGDVIKYEVKSQSDFTVIGIDDSACNINYISAPLEIEHKSGCQERFNGKRHGFIISKEKVSEIGAVDREKNGPHVENLADEKGFARRGRSQAR